jgi:hypothetical protein
LCEDGPQEKEGSKKTNRRARAISDQKWSEMRGKQTADGTARASQFSFFLRLKIRKFQRIAGAWRLFARRSHRHLYPTKTHTASKALVTIAPVPSHSKRVAACRLARSPFQPAPMPGGHK